MFWILKIFRRDKCQISFSVLKKTWATWKHVFLSNSITFYAIFAHLDEKVTSVSGLFSFFLSFFGPFLFLHLLSFCCSDWPTVFASSSKTSKKASSRQAIFAMGSPQVVAGNFALSFTQISKLFCTYFRLHWAYHSHLGITGKMLSSCREVEYRWCQFWLKVMRSEVEQVIRLVTVGMGISGSMQSPSIASQIPIKPYKFKLIHLAILKFLYFHKRVINFLQTVNWKLQCTCSH